MLSTRDTRLCRVSLAWLVQPERLMAIMARTANAQSPCHSRNSNEIHDVKVMADVVTVTCAKDVKPAC